MHKLPMDVIGIIKQFHNNKIFICRILSRDSEGDLTESRIEFISTDLKEAYNYCLKCMPNEMFYWIISDYSLGVILHENVKNYILIEDKLLSYNKNDLEYMRFPLTYNEGKIYSNDLGHPMFYQPPINVEQVII
jgi:hypothetical protein